MCSRRPVHRALSPSTVRMATALNAVERAPVVDQHATELVAVEQSAAEERGRHTAVDIEDEHRQFARACAPIAHTCGADRQRHRRRARPSRKSPAPRPAGPPGARTRGRAGRPAARARVVRAATQCATARRRGIGGERHQILALIADMAGREHQCGATLGVHGDDDAARLHAGALVGGGDIDHGVRERFESDTAGAGVHRRGRRCSGGRRGRGRRRRTAGVGRQQASWRRAMRRSTGATAGDAAATTGGRQARAPIRVRQRPGPLALRPWHQRPARGGRRGDGVRRGSAQGGRAR